MNDQQLLDALIGLNVSFLLGMLILGGVILVIMGSGNKDE